MNDDDLLNKINGAKEQFYNNTQKNSFFKKQQKFDCATSIMSNFDETEVFSRIFVVKNNSIIFNYPLFKTIAHPQLYEKMSNYIFEICSSLVAYDLHIECTGVTVSAIERYKDFVSIVSKQGLANGTGLIKQMNIVYIHNPPSFIDYALQVIIPIVDASLWNKIQLVQK